MYDGHNSIVEIISSLLDAHLLKRILSSIRNEYDFTMIKLFQRILSSIRNEYDFTMIKRL